MTVVSQHGRPDDGSDASPFSNVELFVPLKPYDEWPKGMTKDKLIEAGQQRSFNKQLPGVNFNFSQYIQDNIEEAMSGVKGANSVKIVGPNLETLTKLADAGQGPDGQVRGVTDLGVFPVLGQPNLNIEVDRAKAARYGLNSGDVDSVVQAALGGAVATEVLEGDRQFDMVVRYPPEYRDSIDKIRNIKVAYQTSSGSNAYIPLSELATITWIPARPGSTTRTVSASSRSNSAFADAIWAAQWPKPRSASRRTSPAERLSADWAGEFGELQAASSAWP